MKLINIKNNKLNIINYLILILFLTTSFFTIKYLFFNKKNKHNNAIIARNNQLIYAKPLLYLYPKKEAKITVTFADPKKLKVTYPVYKDKWKVTAKANGDLEDKDRNYYYALYWEEEGKANIDFTKGYYVTKDEARTFLEDKLKYIGLNDKERNEFIIYWLPVLEENDKSVIYFELTEEREKFNKIEINPKPDSLLRVAMHVKRVEKKPNNLEKQKLSHFHRKGFSAIEWGGVVHN